MGIPSVGKPLIGSPLQAIDKRNSDDRTTSGKYLQDLAPCIRQQSGGKVILLIRLHIPFMSAGGSGTEEFCNVIQMVLVSDIALPPPPLPAYLLNINVTNVMCTLPGLAN